MMTANAPVAPASVEELDPGRRLRPAFLAPFLVAALGLWIAIVPPLLISVPLKVKELDPHPSTQGITLSLVLGIGALFGIIANPIAGRISDRTTWRMGMRRPWLIVGAVVTLLGSAILAFRSTVPLAIVGWSIYQIGVNATMSVLLSLMPDHVPARRRGQVSGLFGLMQALAGIIGVVAVGSLSGVFLPGAIVLPGVIALVLITVAAVVLRDRVLLRDQRPRFDLRAFVGSFWVNPRRHPDFGWAWINRFLLLTSVSLVLNYQIFYLTSQLKLTTAAATGLLPVAIGIQTLGIVVVSLLLGPLSDRLRRRKVFVITSTLVVAAGLALIAFAPPSAAGLPFFLAAMAFIGVGQGTYLSVDLALVTEVLPDRDKDAAKDLGVFGMATLIPQSFAPAIAPVFLIVPFLSLTGLAGQNYTALFAAGVVVAALAALSILRVKGTK
jgi:MFS family permease